MLLMSQLVVAMYVVVGLLSMLVCGCCVGCCVACVIGVCVCVCVFRMVVVLVIQRFNN